MATDADTPKPDPQDTPAHKTSNDTSNVEELKSSIQFFFEDGDLNIITSDKVLFKVHKHAMALASPIFKDMISSYKVGTQDTVRIAESDAPFWILFP